QPILRARKHETGRVVMSWATSSWAAASRQLGLGAVIGMCAAVAAWSGAAAAPSDIGIVVTNTVYSDGSIAQVKYAEKDGDAMTPAMRQVFGIDAQKIRRSRNLTKGQPNPLSGREPAPEGTVWRLVESANNRKARLIVYYSGHGVPPFETRDRTRSEAGLLSA